MALTVRLPRWDSHAADRLQQAGIEVRNAPAGYRCQGVEVGLEADSQDDVVRALRGWTVLLPRDFVASA